jgi:predicted kinase
MKTFNKFLTEATGKGAVFSFGRFNPPTTGHAKLVKKLIATAGSDTPLVFTSHSNDKVKNPLTHVDKIKFLRKFFGKIIVDTAARTVFDIAVELERQGYNRIKMVVGSDRVREFDMLLKKYNGVKARHGFYKFDEIEIVSAGERDPDADDTSGMSASKMRQYAEDGDFDNFKDGVPSTNKTQQKQLYNAVRRGMGLTEGTLPFYMQDDLQEDELQEGVYDQGIFKALFLMGGPGSGKTTVVKALSLHTMGLKMINSDQHFERMMKAAKMSMKMTKDGSGEVNPERDGMRSKAKRQAAKQMDLYIPNRLGLVFDTTSAKASKIKTYKEQLDALGYESRMVFVKTSLDLALKLNDGRARTVPVEVVKMEHEAVEKNATIFKRMFTTNFDEIENNDTVKSLRRTAEGKFGSISAWAKKFPTNSIATAWKARELLLKKTK